MSKLDDDYDRWWNSLPEADRKMISAAWERHKAAAPKGGQDRPKDPANGLSEIACYEYPDDTVVAKAQRAAFMEGFVRGVHGNATTADKHKYDRELGRITEQDHEYAVGIVDEIEEHLTDRTEQIRITAEWLRKVRYEAVIADRDKHK